MPERYEILGKLGVGGFGTVYRARDHRLSRDVAIKRTLTDLENLGPHSPDALFTREAKTLAALNHPNVVHIFDFDRDEEGSFVVMELLAGSDLKDRLDEGPLTWEEADQFIRESLEGIEAAHQLGVLHRDLKPENLFLHRRPTGGWVLKILDFGLAKQSASPAKQTMDQRGNIFGSLRFMAPEQIMRQPLDSRADLYSLGCVFYRILGGTNPFHADTSASLMDSHLKHLVAPIRTLNPEIPEVLEEWLMRMIALKPDDRPATAGHALLEYQAALQGQAPWRDAITMAVMDPDPEPILAIPQIETAPQAITRASSPAARPTATPSALQAPRHQPGRPSASVNRAAQPVVPVKPVQPVAAPTSGKPSGPTSGRISAPQSPMRPTPPIASSPQRPLGPGSVRPTVPGAVAPPGKPPVTTRPGVTISGQRPVPSKPVNRTATPPKVVAGVYAEPVISSPVAPLPIESAPVAPVIIEPTPIEPAPIIPIPVEPDIPAPVPVEPTPALPQPLEAAPVAPQPIEPARVSSDKISPEINVAKEEVVSASSLPQATTSPSIPTTVGENSLGPQVPLSTVQASSDDSTSHSITLGKPNIADNKAPTRPPSSSSQPAAPNRPGLGRVTISSSKPVTGGAQTGAPSVASSSKPSSTGHVTQGAKAIVKSNNHKAPITSSSQATPPSHIQKSGSVRLKQPPLKESGTAAATTKSSPPHTKESGRKQSQRYFFILLVIAAVLAIAWILLGRS